MKKVICLLLLASFTLVSTAQAGTAECATITDHDTRMMCFASQTNNSSYCSFIKDHDKRAQCRIMTGN